MTDYTLRKTGLSDDPQAEDYQPHYKGVPVGRIYCAEFAGTKKYRWSIYINGNYIHDSLDRGRGVIYIGFIKNGAKPMTTTNLPKLSTRAQKALDVLADGGKFVCRLERNGYTGREQFAYRLLKEGRVVRGIGLAAFYEIKDTFLTICDNNTSVSTYYQLRREA